MANHKDDCAEFKRWVEQTGNVDLDDDWLIFDPNPIVEKRYKNFYLKWCLFCGADLKGDGLPDIHQRT